MQIKRQLKQDKVFPFMKDPKRIVVVIIRASNSLLFTKSRRGLSPSSDSSRKAPFPRVPLFHSNDFQHMYPCLNDQIPKWCCVTLMKLWLHFYYKQTKKPMKRYSSTLATISYSDYMAILFRSTGIKTQLRPKFFLGDRLLYPIIVIRFLFRFCEFSILCILIACQPL